MEISERLFKQIHEYIIRSIGDSVRCKWCGKAFVLDADDDRTVSAMRIYDEMKAAMVAGDEAAPDPFREVDLFDFPADADPDAQYRVTIKPSIPGAHWPTNKKMVARDWGNLHYKHIPLIRLMMEKRLGRFLFSKNQAIAFPFDALTMLGALIVIRAEEKMRFFEDGQIDYIAASPLFRPLSTGERIPTYDIFVNRETNSITVKEKTHDE